MTFIKGQPSWNKGIKINKDKYPNYGHQKPHSEATKKKISLIHKKSGHQPPHNQLWFKGKKHSLEAKRKIGLSHKGKKLNFIPKMAYKRGHKTWNKGMVGYNAGEKNHNWKGGITPEVMKIRNSAETKQWRIAVFERDDYTCQICGGRGVKLRSNHIKKFSDYKDLRLEVTNGITICERCDRSLVMWHEPEWESYFNFSLINRGILSC